MKKSIGANSRSYNEGFDKFPGKAYEEIEDDLTLDHERNRAGWGLPWDHARHAVRSDIGPRDPDRGIRSGF